MNRNQLTEMCSFIDYIDLIRAYKDKLSKKELENLTDITSIGKKLFTKILKDTFKDYTVRRNTDTYSIISTDKKLARALLFLSQYSSMYGHFHESIRTELSAYYSQIVAIREIISPSNGRAMVRYRIDANEKLFMYVSLAPYRVHFNERTVEDFNRNNIRARIENSEELYQKILELGDAPPIADKVYRFLVRSNYHLHRQIASNKYLITEDFIDYALTRDQRYETQVNLYKDYLKHVESRNKEPIPSMPVETPRVTVTPLVLKPVFRVEEDPEDVPEELIEEEPAETTSNVVQIRIMSRTTPDQDRVAMFNQALERARNNAQQNN